jgi:hypothetical protein
MDLLRFWHHDNLERDYGRPEIVRAEADKTLTGQDRQHQKAGGRENSCGLLPSKRRK